MHITFIYVNITLQKGQKLQRVVNYCIPMKHFVVAEIRLASGKKRRIRGVSSNLFMFSSYFFNALTIIFKVDNTDHEPWLAGMKV